MTQHEIRTLLEQPYDRERWKKLVTALFPGRDVFAKPVLHQPEAQEDRKHVQHIYQFGEAKLKDGELVGLYEAHLLPSVDLARNRASVRKAVEKLVKWGGLSGALISFVDPDKGIWRFSFYSNTLSPEGGWETAHRKRYTYLLGEGEKCRTAAEQFEVLATKAGQVTLKELLDAFSVEKVSKAFFREYKEHYQDFVQHLTGKRMVKKAGKWEEKVMHAPSPKLAAYFNGNEKDARDFCKKLMGRLVFLYFLQKKRWLGATTAAYADGEPDFVYRLFGAQGNDAFYPNVLVPLFFETLNAERTGDDYRMPDGALRKVPFLNGGLFDMDLLDRKTRLLTFPPELFSNPAKADEEKERGFLDFLNAYNFTVHEAGPEEQTLAVDPEMLGHIFENLLEDNKDKGAFYTPKEIVHYMCQESLVQYLKNYLVRARGEEVKKEGSDGLEDQLRRFLQHGEWAELSPYSGVLLKALRNVKVCDPAIGSGAFPMGILHEIFQCVERIHDLSPDETESIWELGEWNPAEVKLRIIQHSIYGVDIERGAVDIARLRFWLSIIVDERAPRTLPNLDYKIVVGDSLLGRFNGEVLEIDWDLKGNTDRVQEVRAAIDVLHAKTKLYFRDQTKAKKEKLEQEIRALKIDLLTKQLELNRDKFRGRMLSVGRIGELTKKEQLRAAEEKIELAAYEEPLGKLRALAKQKDKPLDYFDWHLDFPEVLNANVTDDPGFDIVIGNPPYVSHDKISEKDSAALKIRYASYESFADLFCYFTEKAIALQNHTGVFSFITSNSYLRSEYGTPLRRYIAEQNDVLYLLNIEDSQVFESAIVNVAILIGSRNRLDATAHILNSPLRDTPPNLNRALSISGFEYGQNAFKRKAWSLSEPKSIDTLMRIEAAGPTLDERGTKIRLGLATGHNDAFLINAQQRQEFIHRDKRNDQIIKPILRGRDINRYHYSAPQQFILLTTNGVEVQRDFPHIYAHLDAFGESFKNRGARGRHWTNLRACAFIEDFAKPKIVWIELADTGRFALCTDEIYLVNSAYFMLPPPGVPLLYLLAVLSSVR